MAINTNGMTDVLKAVCELVKRKEQEALVLERKRIAKKFEKCNPCPPGASCDSDDYKRCARCMMEYALSSDEAN